MESGLDGRNNHFEFQEELSIFLVSMESGLDGRNNRRASAVISGYIGPSQWSPA